MTKTKPGKKGARSRELKKTNTRNTILANFPIWNGVAVNVEWTEFCEIDEMKKMNVRHFFVFLMQYLPPSWLGRVTRWQLFNSRTTRHIDCHKNKRNAGQCRHTLRECSLVTDFVQFHISAYQLHVRLEKEIINRSYFYRIQYSITLFHSLAKKVNF